ncbi:uncharacterized protein BO96DRAFT_7 [Aspergillus niger CBS 101883]|uniref:uncharacterized protein n=1 Tax=Aspergillus lacticoffeatus (strain CBS 101883) TaxID=1450533 RepID=UPI000D7F4485|nr:uncharacterized protein BO96DRAFT_7 [Aspergillus niger CBS 101883]PYH61684.1 hypothetical protein BO96DRAFT_7 [Aspergillus niger CBS 101883]
MADFRRSRTGSIKASIYPTRNNTNMKLLTILSATLFVSAMAARPVVDKAAREVPHTI